MSWILRCKKCDFRMIVGYPGRGLAIEAGKKNAPIEQVIEEYYKEMKKSSSRHYELEPDKCPKCGADKKHFEEIAHFD